MSEFREAGRTAVEIPIRAEEVIQSTHREITVAEAVTKDVLMELFKQKQAEAAGLLTTYLRAFAFYLAVMAFTFKAAIDVTQPSVRQTIAALGLGTCAFAVVAALLGERLRRDMHLSLSRILAQLQADVSPDELPGLRYTVIAAMVFNVLTFAGCVMLLLR